MNFPLKRVKFFQNELKKWYRKHKRAFPWRRTRNPFSLFIAEMMLRRTRADQVKPVFQRSIKQFPSPLAVLKAPKQALCLLEPLGLRWRARTLLRALQQIQDEFNGHIQLDPEKLIKLEGVGPYVSNAVVCFSKGTPLPLIDSNVLRVICRYEGIPFRDGLRRNNRMVHRIESFVDRNNPRTYNFALIDFAHAVCTPSNPKCSSCPLRKGCYFFIKKMERRVHNGETVIMKRKNYA
jgi:A/G-specific adenine glycosylase